MQYTIRVKPGSRKGAGVDAAGDELVVRVRERAVDGAANEGVIRVLAAYFSTAPSRVRILRGHGSRIKRVEIDA